MNDQRLLLAREVEEAIGLKATTIYKMASAGLLPSVAVGARLTGVRFVLSDVQSALKLLKKQRPMRAQNAEVME